MAEKKTVLTQEIEVPVGAVKLQGILQIPPDAKGIVLFAHGSGSSRLSPRNQFVAQFLQDGGMATLLLDLLTNEEEQDDMMSRELNFNIPFLANRLHGASDWINQAPQTHHLNIGYFGASTGAAAAMIAASENGAKAVVSRGGRPDLAGQSLSRLRVPTLLIVGGEDHGIIELNERALELMSCPKKLEIVPNATHLFEESGTLEEVGRMATLWFQEYL